MTALNGDRPGGLIARDSIEQLKEAVDIEVVVSPIVTLTKAGGNSLKGLCPFHSENSASFHVRLDHKRWHCFGCGEGGDVFSFVQRTQNVTFAEAILMLAEQFNVRLKYEDNNSGVKQTFNYSNRMRLVEANKLAVKYYIYHLGQPEAEKARAFLTDRGFTPADADLFNCGYSPRELTGLTDVLTKHEFTRQEQIDAGLVLETKRGGLMDRFRGRLMWPIRDTNGATVGFGARKLYEDDDGPKYLNSPETILYKKNKTLFGLDLARKSIASSKRAVIVEGYTDVMACHVAGETTAVAACGTAFGEEHAKMLARLLSDTSFFSGEIIYTFDGDSAGQKAAKKAFEVDSLFKTRTFVAIAAENRDPCEVRLAYGDEGLRELFASRIPLFEFTIRDALSKHDLNTPEGRVNGVRAAAPIVAGIKDHSLRTEYLRLVAGWVGVPVDDVVSAVRYAEGSEAGKPRSTPQNGSNGSSNGSGQYEVSEPLDSGDDRYSGAVGGAEVDVDVPMPTGEEPGHNIQRTLLTAVTRMSRRDSCQYLEYINGRHFTVPAYQTIWEAMLSDPTGSLDTIMDNLGSPNGVRLLSQMLVGDSNYSEPTDEYLKCCVYDLLIFNVEEKTRIVEAKLGAPDLADEEADKLLQSWDKLNSEYDNLNAERSLITIPSK